MRASVMKTGAIVELKMIMKRRLPKEESELVSHAEEAIQTSQLHNGEALLPPSRSRVLGQTGVVGMDRAVEVGVRGEGDYDVGLSEVPGVRALDLFLASLFLFHHYFNSFHREISHISSST